MNINNSINKKIVKNYPRNCPNDIVDVSKCVIVIVLYCNFARLFKNATTTSLSLARQWFAKFEELKDER